MFLISATCTYRVSEINCNSFFMRNGQPIHGEPFVEIERLCKGDSRPKRSPSQAGVVKHALAGITLVIWDRISGTSRVVLSLFNDRTSNDLVVIGSYNFTMDAFFDEKEVSKCLTELNLPLSASCSSSSPMDSRP